MAGIGLKDLVLCNLTKIIIVIIIIKISKMCLMQFFLIEIYLERGIEN